LAEGLIREEYRGAALMKINHSLPYRPHYHCEAATHAGEALSPNARPEALVVSKLARCNDSPDCARRRHAPVDDRDDPMRIGNPKYQKVARSARGTNRSAGNASDLAVNVDPKRRLDMAAGHHSFHDAARMIGSTVGGSISAFNCCTCLEVYDSAQRHAGSML
jgi:hypothetical protein